MPSTRCTPIAVIAPPGDSSGCARQASGVSASPCERGLLGADRHDRPETLLLHRLPQHCHRWVKPPVEADRQHDARCFGGSNSCLRVGDRKGEGLLHEHGLAGASGARDLLRMETVRRSEHDRVDRGVAQNRVQIIDPAETMLAAEISDGGCGAGVGSREAHCLTVPHGVNEIAAPPAETHDGCLNCRAGHAAPNCFEIPLSSVKCDSPIGLPTAAGRYPPAVRPLTSLIDGENPARSYPCCCHSCESGTPGWVPVFAGMTTGKAPASIDALVPPRTLAERNLAAFQTFRGP